MATIEKIVQDSIDGGALGGFKEFEKLHKDFPKMLAYVAGSGVNLGMDSALDEFVTEAGKVRGRSGAGYGTADEESTPVSDLGESEKQYVRPNGEKYFPRKWGVHTDVLVVRKAREAMQFILAYGAPGCGKTALAEAAFGADLFTVMGSGDTEVADFVGGYVQRVKLGVTEFEWIDGPLLKAAEAGAPLLIDEIGLIDPKVLSIVYGLMDGRREYTVTANPDRGTVRAKDGFYVLAATNPNAPGVRISEALLSRFPIHVEMTTDWGLARTLGVPAKIVTAAQNLNSKKEKDEVNWAPQMRELLAYRDLSKTFGEQFAVSNLIASAPEMDRPQVAEVFTRIFADASITAARI